MRIGVDIDGPLYPLVPVLRQWLVSRGRALDGMPAPIHYEFYEQWGMTREQFDLECTRAVRAGVLYVEGTPQPGAPHALTDLLDAGHEVHLVTARPTYCGGVNLRAVTELWLREHTVPYTALHFHANKTRLRADVFIDDHLAHYRALTAAGRSCYLLDQPYNQTPGELIPRVGSLAEFATVLLGESRLLSCENVPWVRLGY